jgi:hypothetical protein
MPLDFQGKFVEKMDEHNLSFEIRGLLTANDMILTLGTDTKVLSTVFELFCRPLIEEIAKDYGKRVETSRQTIYPDFTILSGPDDPEKTAVDIKTTYRRDNGSFGFTIGSYTSFLRNDTKNILYPYSTYSQHWIVGFVYSRRGEGQPGVFPLANREQIQSPYTDVEWFVQEKYKVAGLSPGSGNTTNIASIWSNDIEDFRRGRGPFAMKGEKYFREYWANYGTAGGKRFYRTIEEFEAWKRKHPDCRRFT